MWRLPRLQLEPARPSSTTPPAASTCVRRTLRQVVRVAKYTEADWVRAIRHGVKPDGRAMFVMPSEDYNRFTDADVAALIAYARSLPPVTSGGAEFRVPLPVKALYAAGVVHDASEKIDHSLPPAVPVPEGVTPEHGKYVANLCLGCHGEGLSGGKIPGGPPAWPAASNLTPGTGTVMTVYDSVGQTQGDVPQRQATGWHRHQRDAFETLREISDTDVAALHAYLKTVSPRPAGGR